ncbi:MAG: type II CAAX endopeptidase family protein, partial [Chthoniobacteraceae bacterium]
LPGIAGTTGSNSSETVWDDIAQKNQRPLLAPEPLPAQSTYSTPTPVPVKPVPTPVPEQKVSRSIQEQQLADLLHHDLGSKVIAVFDALFLLALGLAVIVMFFIIRKPNDPAMLIAFNAGLVRLLLSVAANALKPESAINQSQFLIFSIECLTALEFMMVVYVGNYLWRQLGTDYWGIAMWKTNRGRMIEVSLAAIVVSVLYSAVLFLWTHPSAGWAVKFLAKASGASHGGQTAAILLMCATFAFSEEFLFRGCIQPLLTRWFGGTHTASTAAIIITAMLWTFAHAGSLSPDWVKFLQILPLGLFLGWWCKKAGVLGTLAVHLGFNFALVRIAQYLIS